MTTIEQCRGLLRHLLTEAGAGESFDDVTSPLAADIDTLVEHLILAATERMEVRIRQLELELKPPTANDLVYRCQICAWIGSDPDLVKAGRGRLLANGGQKVPCCPACWKKTRRRQAVQVSS